MEDCLGPMRIMTLDRWSMVMAEEAKEEGGKEGEEVVRVCKVV